MGYNIISFSNSTAPLGAKIMTEINGKNVTLRSSMVDNNHFTELLVNREPVEVDYYGVPLEANTTSTVEFSESDSAIREMTEYVAISLDISDTEAKELMTSLIVSSKDRVTVLRELLEKYPNDGDITKKMESARLFVKENLLNDPKDVATQVINHYAGTHFKVTDKDVVVIKQYLQQLQKEKAKADSDAEKAKKEAEAKAEKERKAAEKVAEKERKAAELKAEKDKKVAEKAVEKDKKAAAKAAEEKAKEEEREAKSKESIKAREEMAAEREKNKKPHVNFDMVAERIKRDHFLFAMSDTKEIYLYEGGVFKNYGIDTKMKKVARETYKQIYTEMCIKKGQEVPKYIQEPGKTFTAEVLEKLVIDTVVSRKEIDAIQLKNMHLINLRNCVYNLHTRKAEEHQPAHKFIRQIPIDYDPSARCPKITKFLSEVVSREDAQVLIELAGYGLIPNTRIQKAFLIYGDGANGKSIFLRLLEALTGKENISHVSLQKLQDDKFSVARLYGKNLNIYADLKSSVMEFDELFKQIVGGDTLTGERKYEREFDFENTARLVFSANTQNIPQIKKDDFAYYRRWILIEFIHQFLENGEGASIDDKELIDKLTKPAELSGFLNHAIGALNEVLNTNQFSYTKSIKEVEQIYKMNSSSVTSFVERCTRPSANDGKKYEIHEKYVEWCQVTGLKTSSFIQFGKAMKTLGYKDYRPYDGITGKREPVWENLEIDENKFRSEMENAKKVPVEAPRQDPYADPSKVSPHDAYGVPVEDEY